MAIYKRAPQGAGDLRNSVREILAYGSGVKEGKGDSSAKRGLANKVDAKQMCNEVEADLDQYAFIGTSVEGIALLYNGWQLSGARSR